MSCVKTLFFSLVLLPWGVWGKAPNQPLSLEEYRFQSKQKTQPKVVENVGSAWIQDKEQFPVLDGVTCYIVELWEESMRIPHWHPNASEVGYVLSGAIEVIIWRSPGETAVFTVSEGMSWFIPQSALHSLNNIGDENASLLVSFSSSYPEDIDLPVAFNGVPVPIRDAYTSPHSDLRNWSGVISNPLVGKYPVDPALKDFTTGSPYKFVFSEATPLFSDPKMGSVIWGIKDNWEALQDLSILRAHLKPGVARDAIWYPDVGTLYVVSKGTGQFHIIRPDYTPQPFTVQPFDFIFVPIGTLHTFINNSATDDFEVIAFFTKANPLPEVSLSVATSFFPSGIRKAVLTQYGGVNKPGDPLKDLKFTSVSPYLLQVAPTAPAKKPKSSY